MPKKQIVFNHLSALSQHNTLYNTPSKAQRSINAYDLAIGLQRLTKTEYRGFEMFVPFFFSFGPLVVYAEPFRDNFCTEKRVMRGEFYVRYI